MPHSAENKKERQGSGPPHWRCSVDALLPSGQSPAAPPGAVVLDWALGLGDPGEETHLDLSCSPRRQERIHGCSQKLAGIGQVLQDERGTVTSDTWSRKQDVPQTRSEFLFVLFLGWKAHTLSLTTNFICFFSFFYTINTSQWRSSRQ